MGPQRGAPSGTVTWQQRRDAARARPQAGAPLRLDSPVTDLPRIGTKDVQRLHKLGLETVRDLLLHLPFGWESYGGPTPIADLPLGEHATVVVEVARIAARRTPRQNMKLTEAVVTDDGGSAMKVVWFNQPYLARQLRPGDRIALAGMVRASRYGPGLEMQNPHHERVGDEDAPRQVGGLMPKYHLTEGLSSRRLA